MCSIAGLYAPRAITEEECRTLARMSSAMRHRGPDETGEFHDRDVAFAHNRLSVIDPQNGHQPMSIVHDRKMYTIVYNGEIYNYDELAGELARHGVRLHTRSDTEALLYAYAVFGEKCLSHLNGIYAFAVWDREAGKLFLARDPLGVKPLYFVSKPGFFAFASEVKALLAHPEIPAEVGAEELWQLLYLAPATLPGKTVYRGVFALLPGECMSVCESGLSRRHYYRLHAERYTGTREEAVADVRALVSDAVRQQMRSDVPLASFLSGGLDSSVVSALAAEYAREAGRVLDTYSFEYENNRYAPTLFQPNPDDAYALLAAESIGSAHTVLRAPSDAVAEALAEAALIRDFPGQADIDSSLLYFCRRVKERHTVALSGECADEIFGGYPWFYRPEMLERNFYPWIHSPDARISLFREELALPREGYAYLSARYRDAVAEADVLDSDSEEMRLSRIASHLSQGYFMQSLLERKDRMSMASGLEVRVPFSDPRIAAYLYNVPWEYKFRGGVEKSLLRDAMQGILPNEILYRKKSPYPKTHDAGYERIVREMLERRLARSCSPLAGMLDTARYTALFEGDGRETWLGQLMSRPQLLAWLYQFDVWAEEMRIRFV